MDELESLVDVALADPAMELEIRLGKIAFGRFQTDIPAASWNRVKAHLESYKKWTQTTFELFTDDYFPGHARRRTYLDGRVEIVRKERVVTHDMALPDKPMDLRVSLAREHRLDAIDSFATVASRETKERHRFVHKDLWAFDLTQIEGGLKDIDADCSTRYQIEIEFLSSGSSRKYPRKYLADYGKLLAQDVLSMIG
jgi:hypothetical protein